MGGLTWQGSIPQLAGPAMHPPRCLHEQASESKQQGREMQGVTLGIQARSTRPLRTLISEAFSSSEISPPSGELAHIPVGGSGLPRLT